MRIRHVLAAAAATVLVAGGTLLAAPAASAATPIIWYQSVARPSADAPCPTNSSADTTAGWTEWTPSWEEWANDGKGGPVCTRSITWAYQAGDSGPFVYPSADCVQGSSNEWVDFEGGWSLPYASPVYYVSDCSATSNLTAYDLVYAPGGWDQAAVLCEEAFGSAYAYNPWGYDVYACQNSG